jgi:competence protein ComEA
MPHLSRSQLLVYGAVAVALLLVGARWIRGDNGAGAAGSTQYETGSLKINEDGGGDVVVHVAGAVRRPGVYRLPAGSRVTDAVERAGGPAADAAAEAVNMAARLTDGQQIVVPARGASGGAAAGGDGPISLGTATVDQLDSIEGIGPVTAQKIVEYRQQHGGISSIEELDRISGIGPATMEALRARLQP